MTTDKNESGVRQFYRWSLTVVAIGAIAVMGSVLMTAPVAAHKNATGIVKERMDRFSASQRQLKQMMALLRAGDHQQIGSLAVELAAWADVMPDYFPVGSDDKPSEAAPEIWTDPAGFAAAATAMATAARQVTLVAETGDQDEIKAAITDVAGSCKACHRVYRAR